MQHGPTFGVHSFVPSCPLNAAKQPFAFGWGTLITVPAVPSGTCQSSDNPQASNKSDEHLHQCLWQTSSKKLTIGHNNIQGWLLHLYIDMQTED